MNVVMIGTGYVGLVSGTCFAEFGAHVTCLDIDAQKITRLKAGEIPIYEPGLDALVAKNVEAGRLNFTSDYGQELQAADLIFIAVGTPTRPGDGSADLKYVYQAARDIAPHLRDYTVIVDKSTVPVGTARNVKRVIQQANPQADFDVASNPEFLREGAAIDDFMNPDRVVLGADTTRAAALLEQLYRPVSERNIPILTTNVESAELIKYAANAFLATKITFINELSALCEQVNADVSAVAKGMGLDSRIGSKFLQTGPGYGGSCFPKDTQALVRIAQQHGTSSRIVEAVIEANAAQKARMVKKIVTAMGGTVAGKTIAVLGLTFKPETDDMRDAPALTILPNLLEQGAIIQAHDPEGMSEARKVLPKGIQYSDSVEAALSGAEALVIMTEWKVYQSLDLAQVLKLMQGNTIVDLRNMYVPVRMREAGFEYTSIGRP